MEKTSAFSEIAFNCERDNGTIIKMYFPRKRRHVLWYGIDMYMFYQMVLVVKFQNSVFQILRFIRVSPFHLLKPD